MERFRAEVEGLARSWQRHDSTHLRDYLVRGVEDPRINVQSILTRHFLVDRLFGAKFSALAEAELRFAIVMNWLMKAICVRRRAEQLNVVLDALLDGFAAADFKIPGYVRSCYNSLPFEQNDVLIANYMNEVLMWPPDQPVALPVPQPVLNTFAVAWRRLLARESPAEVSVIEPACGSANDYRAIHAFGIARFLVYHGIDICEKNIANAQAMFPKVSFSCGNAMAIDIPDKSFDLCFVHDLLEHLSLAALERTIEEILRVTRTACCMSFFNASNCTEHVERPMDDYHWNTLSIPRIEELLRRHGCEVESTGIDTWLNAKFRCADTHNKQAWTVVATIKT